MSVTSKVETNAGITLLGLGPGDPKLLTREAWDWLNQIETLYVKTISQSELQSLPKHLRYESFDSLYQDLDNEQAVNNAIIEKILSLGISPGGVTFAVPGHPLIDEKICRKIITKAKSAGIPVHVIAGLSLIESVYSTLDLDTSHQCVIADASVLERCQTPGVQPSSNVLITQMDTIQRVKEIKRILQTVYPKDHPVIFIHRAGTEDQIVENCALAEIDESQLVGAFSALFLPPLPPYASFESFQEVIARLRAPDGCPWDREQTHNSLRPFLLEETYETLDALDRGDLSDLEEELGDLFLQIMLHAQIASENGDFNIYDVIEGISNKLVRRHPHVFSEVEVDGVSGVIKNWEAIKAEERRENDKQEKNGMLDGVPTALPALLQAQEVIERAKRAGLTQWIDVSERDCFSSLVNEIYQADSDSQEALLGEVLFVLTALAHQHDIDAESALRKSLTNFRDRFKKMELFAAELGKPIVDFSEEERNQLWLSTQSNLGNEAIDG